MTRHRHHTPAPRSLDLFPSSLESPPGPAPASHVAGPRTERLAAEKVRPITGGMRRAVVKQAIAAGTDGITGDEACAANPTRTEYSVRPRLTELTKAVWGCLLVETGRTRRNRRGNEEMVYVHRDFA